jgi:hypothetical protein
MGFFPLFLSSLFLPLVSIVLLWIRTRRPWAGWIATLILAAGVTGFSVLAAPWGYFGVPLRFIVALLFLTALVTSIVRKPEDDDRQESPVRHLMKALVGLFFGGVAVGVLASYRVPEGAIDLQFPLKDGTFLVTHGGSESAANAHAFEKGERYGVDLVQLNAFGSRASGLYPRELTRYRIWGAPVLSPCDGTVARITDGLPDNAPGARDLQHKNGNEVVLRCGDADVFLAHLQRGSVSVQPNARVIAGAVVGRAGNSGDAPEPHLHIHAERNGVAVPARLGGRWLVRNAIVRRFGVR